MTVRELIESGEMKLNKYPPYNEKRYEICPRIVKKGDDQESYILDDVINSEFADRKVWLAFHSDGTCADPVNGEHVLRICIE